MSEAKKIAEGVELMRLAEKDLKTSLFKWRPDYDSAADQYMKAAMAFRLGKSYVQSKDCLMKAVECYINNRSWFHAAKCYEQMIQISKDEDSLLNVEVYANKACSLYQQHGSFEAAIAILDKTAKIVESKHPSVALNLHQHALEIASAEDSIHKAVEHASKISRLLVKIKMYDQAADALRMEIGLNRQTETYGQIGRLAVALILVQLRRGDFVAAEKAFKEWGNCCDAQEVQMLECLLQAFDNEDPEGAKQALSSPFIVHMDVEYSLLAREIPLPCGLKNTPKADVIQNATATYMSQNTSPLASVDLNPGTSGQQLGTDDEDLC